MEKTKIKNIYLIPIDKPSKKGDIVVWTGLKIWDGIGEPPHHNQNIYITNDEEIKVNNYITDGYLVWKWKDDSSLLGRKKIILTTSQDLIKDGVQAIDDEFLEWFVKNPSCEEVDVDIRPKVSSPYEKGFVIDNPNYNKIIIPKEETRKNRLLEELIDEVKRQQSFLRSVKKNPQLYYYKFGNCIYERLYNNDNSFQMQDPYNGRSSKMEKELIELKAEKIYYG